MQNVVPARSFHRIASLTSACASAWGLFAMQRSQGRDGLSRFRMGRRVGIYDDLLLLHRRRTCVCACVSRARAVERACMGACATGGAPLAGALAGAFGGSFAPLPLAATGAPGLGRPPGTAQTPWSITVFSNRANVAGGTCPLHAPTLTPKLALSSAECARLARKSSRSVPVLLRLGRLGTCGPFRMLLRHAALQRSGRTGGNCAGHGTFMALSRSSRKTMNHLFARPSRICEAIRRAWHTRSGRGW